jgi:hypothetical protein
MLKRGVPELELLDPTTMAPILHKSANIHLTQHHIPKDYNLQDIQALLIYPSSNSSAVELP